MTIGVRPVNDPPTVSLDPAGPIDEGATPIDLRAEGHDVDGDALTFSWTSDDGTLVSDGATATLAADDGPAEITVEVAVSDGTDTATAQQIVEVRNVAPGSTPAPIARRTGGCRSSSTPPGRPEQRRPCGGHRR